MRRRHSRPDISTEILALRTGRARISNFPRRSDTRVVARVPHTRDPQGGSVCPCADDHRLSVCHPNLIDEEPEQFRRRFVEILRQIDDAVRSASCCRQRIHCGQPP